MGDWGHVTFYYDYTVPKHFLSDGPIRNRGIISNSYKWICVQGLILHIRNGLEYFLNNKEEFAVYGGESASSQWVEESYCEQFRRAFDVIFSLQRIDTSIDNVKSIMSAIDSGEVKIEDFNSYTLGGDGT